MDHLFSDSLSTSTALCYCLDLSMNKPVGHTSTCPVPHLITPFDFDLYIQDPRTLNSRQVHTSLETSTDPFSSRDENQVAQCAGFLRIDHFMQVVNYIRRNVQGCQVFYTVTDQLLRHMFAQLLPIIVGDVDFLKNPHQYYAYAQTREVPVRSFITTARQIGKTTTMAIAVTALMCVADGQDLCKIYARTQNQAINLLSEIKSIFFRIPSHLRPSNILKQNETAVSVISLYNGLALTVSASPGNVEGIRGHKPRLIVVDEYQFTLPEFWTQHIWALTQVTSRILICASTPGEPGSYMAAETNKMKTLPHLYPESQVLDFSLVCQKHRDDDTPLLCRCRLENLPPWKNVAAIRQAQSQYGDGNTGDFIQEVLGEPVSSGTRIFDPKKINEMFQRPLYTLTDQPQGNVVYVAVDPSGGGESELAMASLLYTGDSRVLVIGLDSAMTKRMGAVDITQFIRLHLRKLRTMLPSAVLVPIVEDQGGVPMAQTICDVFRESEFQPSVFLLGHKVMATCRSDGVPTTREIKENMVFLVEQLLNEMRLLFAVNMFTTGNRSCQGNGSCPVASLLTLLATQLTNLFYDDKKHITGKLGPGFKDDLVMALMLGIYWSNKLRTTNRVLVAGQLFV